MESGIPLANGCGMARKTGELPAKAGVKSLSKKLDNTRHGFEQHPGASKTPGAFGKETTRGASEAGEVEGEGSDREE
jgi:hypothetical protein